MQKMIDEMYCGKTDAVIAGVSSDNEYLVMNAILSGARHKIRDERFLKGIDKARTSEVVLLGFPLKSVAEAAYYFLTEKVYVGTDPIVDVLLKNKFDIENM